MLIMSIIWVRTIIFQGLGVDFRENHPCSSAYMQTEQNPYRRYNYVTQVLIRHTVSHRCVNEPFKKLPRV